MSGDRGPRAHHGRGTLGQGSPPLLELVADPVFPPALLLRGPRMLISRGRRPGRPSPLYPQGWLDTRTPRLPVGQAGWGPWALNTGHSLLWDCSCPAPCRAVGWDRPCPGGLACWGRQKLSKRARGRGPGSRPGWGPPTPGTNRGLRLSSVNARERGLGAGLQGQAGCSWRPQGRIRGVLSLRPRAVERQPWTLGLSQGGWPPWATCVFYVRCLPQLRLTPSCSVGLDGLVCLESVAAISGKEAAGGPASHVPGLWRLRLGRCSPGGSVSRPRGGQGLRGCPAGKTEVSGLTGVAAQERGSGGARLWLTGEELGLLS